MDVHSHGKIARVRLVSVASPGGAEVFSPVAIPAAPLLLFTDFSQCRRLSGLISAPRVLHDAEQLALRALLLTFSLAIMINHRPKTLLVASLLFAAGTGLLRAEDYAITTFAGRTLTAGSADGTPGTFNNPLGIAIDAAKNLYVADT